VIVLNRFGYDITTVEGQRDLEQDGYIMGSLMLIGTVVTAASGDMSASTTLGASGLGVSFLSHLNRGFRQKLTGDTE